MIGQHSKVNSPKKPSVIRRKHGSMCSSRAWVLSLSSFEHVYAAFLVKIQRGKKGVRGN